MKKYEFCGEEQMYEFLMGEDLYNPALEIYLWSYNNDGAVAYARLTKEQANTVAEKMAVKGDCWSADLPGNSYIIETEKASEYESESSKLVQENKKAVCSVLGTLLQDNSRDWYRADASYCDKRIKNVLLNGSNECELLLAKDDYALVKRNTKFDPYIVVYKPKVILGKITWCQGHYIHKFKDAIQLFKQKTNLEEKDIVVIRTKDGKYVQSVNDTLFENAPSEKLFNFTDDLLEAKLFLHHDVYAVIPDNTEWINKLKISKLEMQMALQNNKTKPKAKLASREKSSNHQCLHR